MLLINKSSHVLYGLSRISIENIAKYCNTVAKTKPKKGFCLISCNRKKLDHYTNFHYNKLDEVPLASKGWLHSKSKGDYFQINPLPSSDNEETVSFQQMGINNDLINCLKEDNILAATRFQAEAIEAIHNRNHILLSAETGCGKTVAYLLPLIQNIIGENNDDLNTPKIVVVLPNRELAYQVGEVAGKLSASVGLKTAVITGGRTKKIMMNPTFDTIDILVATPGALSKLSTVGVYKLQNVKYLVLDEADTLLDDSFQDRVDTLIKRMSAAQFILVSATIPRKLPDSLAPIESTLQQIVSDKVHRPLVHVYQKFIRTTKSGKPSLLLQLTKNNKNPMIIFSNRNETSNWLAMFLRENGVNCANINGDMNYAIRIDQWNQFVRNEALVLSATDVASRGLNTIQVQQVLNYDFPFYAADYLHRVGRVGRIGSPKNCKITNFISGPQEIKLVQQIEMAIRKNEPLGNVDGNITNIIQKRIIRQMREIV